MEYKLTLDDAIEKHKAGHITVKGLLHIYLHIMGGNVEESKKEICQKLKISKAAFYKALNQLEAQNLISWDVQQISVMIK